MSEQRSNTKRRYSLDYSPRKTCPSRSCWIARDPLTGCINKKGTGTLCWAAWPIHGGTCVLGQMAERLRVAAGSIPSLLLLLPRGSRIAHPPKDVEKRVALKLRKSIRETI